MKLHSALITIFSLFFLLAITTKSQDFPVGSCGDQADGALCAEGFCCSKWGWCGNTSAYCDAENCQSQCPPPPTPPPPQGPIQCGIQHGGATCPSGMCCSTNGFCYNENLRPFCMGHFCQSQCKFQSPPPPLPPHPIQCGVQHGGATCPAHMCCTVWGHCENSRGPHCRRELCQSQCGGTPTCGVDAGGALCGRGQCCTKEGACVLWTAPVCYAPFCQDQCRFVPVEPARISMVNAIA